MKKFLEFACGALLIMTLLVGCSTVPSGLTAEKDNGPIFDEEYPKIYNYCPSVIVEDDTAHIWYCSNYSSGSNGDHIFYRTGSRVDGQWYWGGKQLALSPGESGEWDSANVCDPSVIKGEFSYQGKTYNYLMAYLGCRTYGNYENSFGFAVSKELGGEWIKVRTEALCPMYDYYSLYENAQDGMELWGTGQVSLINADQKGRVLLFYTQHFDPDWGQMVERWDLSDLDNPTKEFSARLPANGLKQRGSDATDYITNADFMYDPVRNVIYVATDVHPFGPDYPNNIPSVSRIAYLDLTSETEGVIGDTFKDNVYWYDIVQLSENMTGQQRHSNMAFERTEYGYMPNVDKINAFFTTSETKQEEDWQLIYTWRIYRFIYDL